MENLFIITTPFQLLGSFEAISKFELKNNTLIVLDNNLTNNMNQLSRLIEQNKHLYSNIIRFGGDKKSKFFKNVKLIKKFQKKSFKNVFIGDLGSIQKIFISNMKSEKLFLLDDGGKTILIHNEIKEGKNLFKDGIRQLRFKLLGIKTSTTKIINFFTFFNLETINDIDIINHDFEYFKKINNLINKEIEDKIYVLGQPLVENRRVSDDTYIDYLNKVISKFPKCEVYYLMHRREEKERLLSYTLNRKINIIESKQPGEFYFAELDFKPKAIIGINTTLLFSLKRIFNDLEVLSFRINKKEILKSFNWFEDAYKYFKENNIKIIE
ncbi:polysialyltransferase family glycosyltransferase [Arcobacter sp. LA11]|uniref:polysialyltransferase family glycosyltransferase n=1 Tax=Arcobacter sp. LA11 TaxID=1898176 RepID=UPI0009330555|nr:polysialyltransferase family glycosyltransferase [Arcobacter sp. LA11]